MLITTFTHPTRALVETVEREARRYLEIRAKTDALRAEFEAEFKKGGYDETHFAIADGLNESITPPEVAAKILDALFR